MIKPEEPFLNSLLYDLPYEKAENPILKTSKVEITKEIS